MLVIMSYAFTECVRGKTNVYCYELRIKNKVYILRRIRIMHSVRKNKKEILYHKKSRYPSSEYED